jgi:hypothetical protein
VGSYTSKIYLSENILIAEDGAKIDTIIAEINKAYCYNVADFSVIMQTIRRLNFLLLVVKTPEVKTEEFEHLTISNDFQNLFDIAKIVSWENYVFPIDFYEVKGNEATFRCQQRKAPVLFKPAKQLKPNVCRKAI